MSHRQTSTGASPISGKTVAPSPCLQSGRPCSSCSLSTSLSALLTFVMQYIMSDVAQKTTYDMRRELDYKLAVLPLRYYDMHSNGEILSRMTNDMDTISTTLQQSLTQVIVSVFQVLGYIYMMLTISGKLTIVTLATLRCTSSRRHSSHENRRNSTVHSRCTLVASAVMQRRCTPATASSRRLAMSRTRLPPSKQSTMICTRSGGKLSSCQVSCFP